MDLPRIALLLFGTFSHIPHDISDKTDFFIAIIIIDLFYFCFYTFLQIYGTHCDSAMSVSMLVCLYVCLSGGFKSTYASLKLKA